MNNINKIYKQTKEKEKQRPRYAKDLKIKRAEGLKYEKAICEAFNKLDSNFKLELKDGHGSTGARFFSSFDANLTNKDTGDIISEQVEIKGRSQWRGKNFPYQTIIVNKNKIDNSGKNSLIIYCNKNCSSFLWTWDLTQLLQFPSRMFEINKRKGDQKNIVIDIPVSYLNVGLESLIEFLDLTFDENQL